MTTASTVDVFFRPRGVAVIGASPNPQKLGYRAVHNLAQYGYTGPIYPINHHAPEVLGHRAYASLADVPDPLDLAIIMIPASKVPAALEACGQRGVQAAIVISSGFREVGPEGLALEEDILRIARHYEMRVLGPNIIGVIDTHTRLNTTFVTGMPEPGSIAFLSQSGAICTAVIEWAREAGIGFSRLVSLGNQADVNETDMLRAIGHDPQTRVITAYIEGITDGSAFVAAATEVARRIPVLAIKAGRGDAGVQAVASHTGSLAGQTAAYAAAFRRAGVLWADTLEELFDWARALAWQPLPAGNRVAILTNAGGLGILTLDAIETAGLKAAPLTAVTKTYLRPRVPAAASINNPIDLLAGPGPATYALCLDALLKDETVDAVVVLTAPQDWFSPTSLAEVIGEFNGCGKPILSVIMGIAPDADTPAVLQRHHIPNFTFPERVGSTLAAMWQRRQWLTAITQPGDDAPPDNCDPEAARAILKQVMPGAWLTPTAVDSLLSAYDIPTPEAGLAPDLERALTLAERIGYPVALKLVAEDVVHKSELGGVALNVNGPAHLREQFMAIIARATEKMPETMPGIYVQHMMPSGVELIVGMARDPQFGPLVMVGIGGVQVELMRDVAFELAPLTYTQAEAMLDRTGASTLLAGFRGMPSADRAAVVEVIVRLAQLAYEQPMVAEIEINPLMVMAENAGAWAVDVRARVESP